MTDTTHSPADIIRDAVWKTYGIQPMGGSVAEIMQALTDAGYAIADLSTHAVVPRGLWEKLNERAAGNTRDMDA